MTKDDAPAVAATPSAPPATTISYPVDRCIRIENFDDGGLTTGSRDIEIYLPKGYDKSAECYPVIYLNDGRAVLSDNLEDVLYVDVSYDKLIDEGLINPAIFVAIFNPDPGRMKDLTPPLDRSMYTYPSGGLDGYYRFISERLKPYIDNHYRTKPEPESTGIAGFSLGGLAAFLMSYQHPETFGVAGCMSPSFMWGPDYALNILRDDESGKKPVRIWLDMGGGERTWGYVSRAYGMLEQRGWLTGDDLAGYLDYPADHTWQAACCLI